ncbi:MAG: hypothetical protein ACRDCW_02640 [Sarcina sp.]
MMTPKHIEDVAAGMNRHGMATYLVIFICGLFIFSNYMLLGKIDGMLSRMDSLIEKQIVISDMSVRMIDVQIQSNEINRKMDYLILKANNDEAVIKALFNSPTKQK